MSVFAIPLNELRISAPSLERLIQACLNGVFGLLLARMNGTEIPQEIQEQIEHFGKVMSFLSHHAQEKA